MKKLLILPLVILAAGCGSQAVADTHNVTMTEPGTTTQLPPVTVQSPPKVVTKVKIKKIRVTNQAQVLACKMVIHYALASEKHLLNAAVLYEKQIAPAYKAGVMGGSVSGITAKVRAGNDQVNTGTAAIKKARGFATQCAG